MANRNYGQDYDDRNRGEGRGREWGAGERGGGQEQRRGDWESQGRGGYDRDIDWRSDWRTGRDWEHGREGYGAAETYGAGNTSVGYPSGAPGAGYTGGYGQSGTMGGFRMHTGSPGLIGSGDFGASRYARREYQSRQGGSGGREVWSEGPHAGRGPKGYQRSNERIHEEVCEVLTRHGHVDARDIEIRVEDGEVTLEGTVGSRREKRLAEEAVENLSGVKDVHNHLRIDRQAGNGGAHQETSAAHQSGLEAASRGSVPEGLRHPAQG